MWCIGLAALLTVVGLPAARAQDARHYDIPAGALSTVASRFAGEARLLLSADARLTENRDSAGVRGTYTVTEAWERLLAGTGLRAVRTAQGYSLQAVPPQDEAIVLDAVRVEGAAPPADADRPYATPGSSSHLDLEHLERFRGTSVGDIFQGLPGVLVGENRNSGGLDINIRGMQGQNRVPVLVDGARQEGTVYRGYAGVASRSYIDPDLIGSVEIHKGPTLSAQGAGAVGGLVSARTLRADDIIAADRNSGIRLRASALNNNSGSPAAPGTPVGYNVGAGNYRTDCRLSEASCGGRYALSGIAAPEDTLDRPGTLDFRGWAGSLALARRFDWADVVLAHAMRSQGNYYAGAHGPAPWIDYSDTSPGRFWTEVRPVLYGASRFRAEERVVNSNYESESTLLKSTLHLPQEQELELSWLRYHSVHGELMPSQLSGVVSGVEGIDFIRQSDNSRITAHTLASRYHWAPAQYDTIDRSGVG